MRDRRSAYWVLMGRPDESRPLLGRRRCRWDDDIKMYLRETGWEGMDWIDLAQGRDRWWAFVYAVMNFGTV
jgi:hypothetical protein